jgi:NADH-quinone oxidoreductase subunit H
MDGWDVFLPFLVLSRPFFICGIPLRASFPAAVDQLMAYGWKVMFPLALLNIVVTAGILLAIRL